MTATLHEAGSPIWNVCLSSTSAATVQVGGSGPSHLPLLGGAPFAWRQGKILPFGRACVVPSIKLPLPERACVAPDGARGTIERPGSGKSLLCHGNLLGRRQLMSALLTIGCRRAPWGMRTKRCSPWLPLHSRGSLGRPTEGYNAERNEALRFRASDTWD